MTGVAYRRLRDYVVVSGPDAEEYLQGQLSQDVIGLSEGASAWSFVLNPLGKVDVWLRVNRQGSSEFLLDLDSGFGEVLIARLRRFMLRTRCHVERLDWQMLTFVGADPVAPAGGLSVGVDWPQLDAVDLLGPSVEIPSGVVLLEAPAWERCRIIAGIPAMGAELDESTIPAATGLVDRSVNFSKGCYTGQELVARIDSRSAGAPTRLVRVEGRLETGAQLPPVGSELETEGLTSGRLTSVTADGSRFVALAYLKRAVSEQGALLVSWEDGEVSVSILDD